MRLEGEEQSRNVEDRRGRGGARTAGGIGLVGLLILLGISLLTVQDPTRLLRVLQQTQALPEQAPGPAHAGGSGELMRQCPNATLASSFPLTVWNYWRRVLAYGAGAALAYNCRKIWLKPIPGSEAILDDGTQAGRP